MNELGMALLSGQEQGRQDYMRRQRLARMQPQRTKQDWRNLHWKSQVKMARAYGYEGKDATEARAVLAENLKD